MARTNGPAPAPQTPPQPPALTTTRPWLTIGCSRSAWFRWRSEGIAPRPLDLPGCRPTWRVSDLVRWLDKVRLARPRFARVPSTPPVEDQPTDPPADPPAPTPGPRPGQGGIEESQRS
jgi:predicted DNA-binding transcriptional regulator AlpA